MPVTPGQKWAGKLTSSPKHAGFTQILWKTCVWAKAIEAANTAELPWSFNPGQASTQANGHAAVCITSGGILWLTLGLTFPHRNTEARGGSYKTVRAFCHSSETQPQANGLQNRKSPSKMMSNECSHIRKSKKIKKSRNKIYVSKKQNRLTQGYLKIPAKQNI